MTRYHNAVNSLAVRMIDIHKKSVPRSRGGAMSPLGSNTGRHHLPFHNCECEPKAIPKKNKVVRHESSIIAAVLCLGQSGFTPLPN